MTLASRIKESKLAQGGRLFVTRIPGSGHVWVDGSTLGGVRLAGSRALAEAHAAMLMDGTAQKSKCDIQIALDKLGATLSFSVTSDRLAWHLHCRQQDLAAMLALIVEILRDASFPAKELAALKKRAAADLAQEGQNTRAQAMIALSHITFPEGHPNRAEETAAVAADFAALTSKRLRAYHTRAVDASSVILSIAGDITAPEAKRVADLKLGRLPKGAVTLPPFAAAIPSANKDARIPIKDKASIDYCFGAATGITKDHPDYPALVLGLQILGDRNGFSGRLMKTVRERDGLTYGVYAVPSGFGTADGAALISATFAPQLFEKGTAAIQREVASLLKTGPDRAELTMHARMHAARVAVALGSAAAFARTAHQLAAEGRPLSYLDTFPEQILALTPAQVTATLRKYLAPENLSSAAAGSFAS